MILNKIQSLLLLIAFLVSFQNSAIGLDQDRAKIKPGLVAKLSTVKILRRDEINDPKINSEIGSGVIIEGETSANEKGEYNYTVITNQHVIDPTREKNFNSSPTFYVKIDGADKPYEVKFTYVAYFVDLAILRFTSPRKENVIQMSDDLLNPKEEIYISGWGSTSGNKIFTLVATNVLKSDSKQIDYKIGTHTSTGMSGGSILNLYGQLVGIHKKQGIGIPIKQVQLILDIYKSKHALSEKGRPGFCDQLLFSYCYFEELK
jgi:S1-C subfamily serine protease